MKLIGSCITRGGYDAKVCKLKSIGTSQWILRGAIFLDGIWWLTSWNVSGTNLDDVSCFDLKRKIS